MVLLTGASTTTTNYRPGPTTTPQPRTATMKQEEEDEAAGELRRGPWTVDEDLTLVNYIAEHGDGRWNALARAAGLKRTGKSCRLRWLNYLRPDVKRGDFTAEEQLLILDLHSRWGNRWSKIAQQLPGRTDNEIKNYWRTRVQKHARQLNCDVNSRRFRDAMTYLWMPRLAERAAAAAAETKQQQHSSAVGVAAAAAAAPCLSAVTNTTTHDVAANYTTTTTSCCLPENTNSYYDLSPGGSSSGLVPSSSSSDSSLTSVESSAAAHEEKSVYHHHLTHDGGAADFWTATMQQGAAADHESFWSAAVPEELNDMPDLTGWVQGFSDDHSLWSLDDIWRMPQ